MNTYHDFFIGRIYTIVKKTEYGDFHFENRSREWHGFVLVTEGEGVFIDNSGTSHPFAKGDIALLGRGCHYQIHMHEKCSYITSAFDLCIDGLHEHQLFPQIIHLGEEMTERFQELTALFSSRIETSVIESRMILTSLYMRLLTTIALHSSTVNKEAEMAERIIQRTYRENLSVSEIAKKCNVSPSYLRALFLRAFGISVTRYREQLRIEEAEILIRCGFFTIHEIAEQLGYCDVSHFTKRFTKAKGISPSKYRDKYLCE